MVDKAKSYCTCYTKEEIAEKPELSIKYTVYREVDCSDGNTCDRCGHYVRWMIDFNPKLHNGHKVRKYRNAEKERKRYDDYWDTTYKVHLFNWKP